MTRALPPRAVWQFGFNQPSPIDAVLDKEGVTLSDILAEEELIQECKAINPKLVDLCVRVITPLVSLLAGVLPARPRAQLQRAG